MSALDKIIFIDSVKQHTDIHSIIKSIVQKVREIPNVNSLHANVDLIVWLCLVIDQLIIDSKLKNIDKFQLFKTIYLEIFPDTTDQDFTMFKSIIDYLHRINQIKGVKTNYEKICRNVKSFIKIILGILSLS